VIVIYGFFPIFVPLFYCSEVRTHENFILCQVGVLLFWTYTPTCLVINTEQRGSALFTSSNYNSPDLFLSSRAHIAQVSISDCS